MPLYFRIQPKGLEIAGHASLSSEEARWMPTEEEQERPESSTGLDVFPYASDTLDTDVDADRYGDEVLVIDASGHWDNGDVEGVRIDPNAARVVARVSLKKWTATWRELFGERCERRGARGDDDARVLAKLGINCGN